MSLAPVYSLPPTLFLPSLPFPIPKPGTVISFMEQRQSKAENATNDITLSLNKPTTHGIIIKGGMETPGCLSNVTICIAAPPLHSHAVSRLPPVLVGNSLIGNSESKKGKGKKTQLCHVSSSADCTSTCRSDTGTHMELNCMSTERKSGARSAKRRLQLSGRGWLRGDSRWKFMNVFFRWWGGSRFGW